MKKILISITIFMMVIMGLSNMVFASSAHLDNITLIDSEHMNENVLFNQYTIDSAFDAQASKTTRDVFTYTLKQDATTKLATWTYASPHDYSLHTLMDIAKDYEANHPGWIVLGGVNAEGYYEGELTNAFVQDGDVIRKDVSAEVFKELIGFKPDGSYVIKQTPVASTYPRLHLNDKYYDVKYINELPSENEISILTPDLASTLDLSSFTVIEGNYSLYRRSEKFPGGTLNGPNLGIFVKGKINGVVNFASISKVADYKFYLVTNNTNVIGELTPNLEVKCQYDYIDEYSDVESMVGYMYKLLINNETIPVNYIDTTDNGQKVVYDCAYYKTTSKERCGIGFKEDGSIVLLTTNTGKGGPTQYEVGEMFKEFGCTDAYQFDGGGSVTFLKRNELGQFEMLNTPGDGSPRSIMSGLFIVTRDPAYSQNIPASTASTITLNKKTGSFYDGITNYQVELNGNTYTPVNDVVTITGLDDDTDYSLNISYEVNGEKVSSTLLVKTKNFVPKLDVISLHNGFRINDYTSDEYLKINKIVFDIDGEKYVLENDKTIDITGLNKDCEYFISYEYTYTNIITNEVFTKAVSESSYTTLSYQAPTIDKFELYSSNDTRIIIKYQYSDVDTLVDEAYLEVNNEIYELTVSLGNKRIDGLDLVNNDYTIVLKLKYTTPEGRVKYLSSEKIVVEKTGQEEHVHNFVEATCETPKTCIECGEEVGEPLGHDWIEATKTNPKTCARCGKTEGEPLPSTPDTPTPDVPDEPAPKKGCKKCLDSTIYLMSIVVLCATIVFVKKNK